MLPNAAREPINDGLHAFCCEVDRRQSSNGFGAHALEVIKPEDKAVPLLIGASRAIVYLVVDLFQKNLSLHGLRAAKAAALRGRFEVFVQLIGLRRAALLRIERLEVIVSDIDGDRLDISEYRLVGMLAGELQQRTASIFTKF